jgi:hypothetical protein
MLADGFDGVPAVRTLPVYSVVSSVTSAVSVTFSAVEPVPKPA